VEVVSDTAYFKDAAITIPSRTAFKCLREAGDEPPYPACNPPSANLPNVHWTR